MPDTAAVQRDAGENGRETAAGYALVLGQCVQSGYLAMQWALHGM